MHHHLNVDPAGHRTDSFTPSSVSITRTFPSVSIVPPIVDLLKQDAAVAIGVSGGKDSQAAAMATFECLDRIVAIVIRRLEGGYRIEEHSQYL